MKRPKSFHVFLLILILISCYSINAQRLEAEDAVLAGGATKKSNTASSGGAYVEQNEGNLTFNVSLPSEGYYNVHVRAAAPSGHKTNIFVVDEHSIDFLLTATDFQTVKVVSALKLSSGNHVLKITKSWGYISIDFIELEKVASSERFNLNTSLVSPEPNEGAARLYQFLYDNYGKKIISGVMTLNSFDETEWLKTSTGKEPALIGLDFMHSGRNFSWYNDKQPIIDAKAYYHRNGVPALCWHWRDPSRKTEEFYTDKTSFDISKIFDETSVEYQAMINDIDFIAGLLKELQDENIPVIWRPLHEAAGGWFWWGAKGAAPCKKLYQVMFDRMVNHHGLRNLIWVWTREPNDDEWYPGDEYVDIVGRDIYKEGNHTSHILEFSDMNERYGKKKMIALSECGSFPDPDNLVKDGAAWSWFMPWYGSFVRDSRYNPLSLWTETMDHAYVLTLDEMPDLKTYEAVDPEPEPEPNPVTSADDAVRSGLSVYPTMVDDLITIRQTTPGQQHVIIFNAIGEKLVDQYFTSPSMVMSLSELKQGLYFVQLSGGKTLRIFKK